ncbi:unnamed protein product [Owenia fusiformis]|uniref:Alcohol dehydrogenase n=1 Tax=Owenia fusiformis TaxID=6347 RepID=A0A8S4PFU0_OWEFU|nr:unnamed protein product [Owenia fusiformis]
MYKCMEAPGPRQDMVLTEKPIPSPPPIGMVVKVKYAGVCHSDVKTWEDDIFLEEGNITRKSDFDPDYKFPIVLGHEISGTVYSLGDSENKDADTFQIGDKVVVFTFCGCTECSFCTAGDNRWCPKMISNNIGVGKNGGFAEYVSVKNRAYVSKVPANIPMDVAPMMSCGALTAYNGVDLVKESIKKWINWKGAATVLIIGAGGLGLWGVSLCKAVLPKETRIAVADLSSEKLESSKAIGADITILWDLKDDTATTIEKTKKALGGLAESSIDFVGNPSTLKTAVHVSAKGATVAVVGLFGGAATIPVPFFPMKILNVVGTYTGSTVHFKELLEIVDKNKIVGPTIFHYKLEDVNEIFRKLKNREINGRAILEFDD